MEASFGPRARNILCDHKITEERSYVHALHAVSRLLMKESSTRILGLPVDDFNAQLIDFERVRLVDRNYLVMC